MESGLTSQFLSIGYHEEPEEGADLVSPDGGVAYEIKLTGRGVRDLRSAVVGLAIFLAHHPIAKHGYVLASLIRISSKRVRNEWERIQKTLRQDLAARMYLVAVIDRAEVIQVPKVQHTPVVDRFLELAVTALDSASQSTSSPERTTRTGSSPATTWKHLEVEKVLLHRWLLGEKTLPIGALCGQVGCSYPTATEVIRRLSDHDLILRGRGRSVALRKYPRDRWPELLRAQRLIYPPAEFIDPIAEPGAVDAIARRLNRLRPKDAALGGVIAARRWDPSFDLNGTPRVDVVLHTPVGRAPSGEEWIRTATEFVRRIDPALKLRTPQARGATVLVLHPLYRRNALFLEEPQSPMPWADPVEVLCHLNDLGLTAQAAQLLQRLRQDSTT
jgi:hypothetical protein